MTAAIAVVVLGVKCLTTDTTEPTSPSPTPVVGRSAPRPASTEVMLVLGKGGLAVRIRDQEGVPIPARLTFVGVGGTRRPAFTTTDIGLEAPGAVLAFDRAFTRGDAMLQLPPGSYDVWVSHGPEWDAVAKRVTIVVGATATLDAVLRHVVETPGWLSGDFHVHAAKSFDSKVPMRDRVLQFVADGVDLIVATDHNVIADYGPVIAELGLSASLASLQGDEITTHDWGHFGAFPLAGDDAEAGRGAIPVGKRTPTALFADIRSRFPGAVLDVHHPRLENGRIGYFHLAELDSKSLHAKRPGFSMDFDAIEVLNGYQDPDRHSVDAVLADWYVFLRHGYHITATGNSDSHHLTFNLGGYPRNYVRVADDRPDRLDVTALVASIKAGRSFFTTGPFVEVTIGDRGLGDTVVAVNGEVTLQVAIRAPGWISVDRVTVIVDGRAVLVRPTTGPPPVRFDGLLRVPVARDSFVIVRVDGDRPMAPIIGDDDKFRVYPLAITNPIWVDADGDGKITPDVPEPP